MTTTVIGIDPGLSGGIAINWPPSKPVAEKMPATPTDLLELLRRYIFVNESSVAFIEKVNAGPKMGSSAAFKFGQNVGQILALCVACGFRIEYVSPQKWQRALGLIVSGRGLGQNDTAKKNRNKARAQELFPGIKITHAIADALLIAEFGRRQLLTPTEGE